MPRLGLLWFEALWEEGQPPPMGAGRQKADQTAQGADEMFLPGMNSWNIQLQTLRIYTRGEIWWGFWPKNYTIDKSVVKMYLHNQN